MPKAWLAVVVLAACSPRLEPAIASFLATPTLIAAGASAELQWQTNGAAPCSVAPQVGEVSAAGAVPVTPAETTAYTLTCGSAVARVTVTVQRPVRIDSFLANPTASPVAGSPVVLTWAARDAASCFLTTVGTVAAVGSTTVSPVATATWQLTCEGFQGPVFALATTEVLTATLSIPTQVVAVAGDGRLTLSWKQTGGMSKVYFSRATGVKKSNVTTIAGGQLYSAVTSPLEVTGLVNGTAYFFVVTAVVGSAESAESAEGTGTPVAAVAMPDPYFGNQWHLSNTGQRGGTAGEDVRALMAWGQGVKGEGVRVAIVDEGVDFQHEDLAANVSELLSHDYLGNAPLAFAEHGTCVAGLVAARDENGVGLRGVAPRSNLVSYNLLQDLTTVNELDAMTRGKQTNGVSSNSWGDAEDGTGQLSWPEPLWLQGVAEGTSTGRGGLGTVYVWAAGNGGDSQHVDNANYDGQTNSRFVLSVAGVGDDGRKVTYSEEGANVLLSAPTLGRAGHGLSTTDITGSLGYNTGNVPFDTTNASYTDLMDGTSGSTPIVAGVAALVLQANEGLTWRDVRRVLAYSARKNHVADPGWVNNLAGLHVNHKYGFGVVDANAAVSLAKTFVAGAAEVSFSSPLVSPGTAIPDNSATGTSSALTVASSGVGHVEFIEVTVSISHPRSGDLEILLDRGAGPVDVLASPHSCARLNGVEQCSAIQAFTFGTVRHLDEPADGTWTLRVNDRQSGSSGTLQSWQLKLWGRP